VLLRPPRHFPANNTEPHCLPPHELNIDRDPERAESQDLLVDCKQWHTDTRALVQAPAVIRSEEMIRAGANRQR
jgi:hypothetical protein